MGKTALNAQLVTSNNWTKTVFFIISNLLTAEDTWLKNIALRAHLNRWAKCRLIIKKLPEVLIYLLYFNIVLW